MVHAEVPLPLNDELAVTVARTRTERRAQARWTPVAPAEAVPEQVAAAGWYPEPARLRFWDGERWTARVLAAAPPAAGARVVVPAWEAPAPAPPAGLDPRPVAEVPPPAAWPAVAAPAGREVAVLGMAGSEEPARRMRHEMGILTFVVLVALLAGAAVAALGIALTV